MTTPDNPQTLASRFKAFLDRHRVQALATFAVIVALTFIAAQILPPVQQFVLKRGVIQYATLLLVLDLAVSVFLQQAPGRTRLSQNQDESLPRLIEAVPHCRTDGVDLLEYAGATTLPLIRDIQREGVPLRMLVKHPDTVSGLQKQRMITTLDTLYNSIFDGYTGKFEVRCYRLPFNVRGRRLGGEVLELGWLTTDLKRQSAYGHSNPSVIADLSTKSNEYLREFFDRTFSDLWTAADTEDGRAVLTRLQSGN
jgi:hypothetical protein